MNFRRSILLPALLIVSSMVFGAISADPAMAQKRGKRPDHSAKLNLSEQQRQKLKKHIEESRERSRPVRESLHKARTELFQQLGRYKFDERKVNDTVRRIGELRRKVLMLSLENQKGLREILTKEQFAELGDAIGDRGGRFEGAGSGDGAPAGGDIRNLKLTPEQTKEINALFRKSREQTEAIAAKLRSDSERLRKLYLNYNLDTKQAMALIERLNDRRTEMLKATVSRQVELRKILTEPQFEALAKTMRPPENGRRGGWKNR